MNLERQDKVMTGSQPLIHGEMLRLGHLICDESLESFHQSSARPRIIFCGSSCCDIGDSRNLLLDDYDCLLLVVNGFWFLKIECEEIPNEFQHVHVVKYSFDACTNETEFLNFCNMNQIPGIVLLSSNPAGKCLLAKTYECNIAYDFLHEQIKSPVFKIVSDVVMGKDGVLNFNNGVLKSIESEIQYVKREDGGPQHIIKKVKLDDVIT
jgi:hypothetical protein